MKPSLLLILAITTSLCAAEPASRPASTQPAATRPAEAAPANQAAVAKVAIAGRPAGISAKQQKEMQKNSIKNMPDGGTFKMNDIVRFTIQDGRVMADWSAKFPSGQAKRIKIEGSDATWMVNVFSSGVNAYFSLTRYDFDAPDDDFWMTSFNYQEGVNVLTMYAQGGDANEVMRMYFTQQPNSVSLNLSGFENNRHKQIMMANAPNLFQLRASYPAEVRRFIVPLLKKMTGISLLPGPSDVYRVFTQIPADAKVTSQIEEILPGLIAQEPADRDDAMKRLAALGAPGALAALRFDPEQLLPEQANRLAELVALHSRIPMDDSAKAAKDPWFLIDALESDDLTVRIAARDALAKVLARAIEFDPRASVKDREEAADQLRKQVAREKPAETPLPPQPVPPPAPAIKLRG